MPKVQLISREGAARTLDIFFEETRPVFLRVDNRLFVLMNCKPPIYLFLEAEWYDATASAAMQWGTKNINETTERNHAAN